MSKTIRRRSGRGAASALAGVLCAAALLGLAASAEAQSVVPGRPVSTVTIGTNLVQQIPQSFLGLSINEEEMEDFTNQPAFLNIINDILDPPSSGAGPFVLRVGGTYSDSSYWQGDQSQVLPEYQDDSGLEYTLNQGWMNSLAGVMQATGGKAIINVNAVAHDPQMAADVVRAAEQTLPAGSLMAVAIGNEPNLYTLANNTVANNTAWVRAFTPDQYSSVFGSYAQTLRKDFPTLTLAGPESSGATTNWTSQLLQADAGQVGLVTSHVYPLNACDTPGNGFYPTIGHYLTNTLVSETTSSLAQLLTLAHSIGLPYRLTELGSATCNGVSGVNDTFATSLWVINQLFSFITAGLDGVNVHLRTNEPNTAIMNTGAGLQAEPLLYGMAAFVDALQPNDVLTGTSGQLQPNVDIWPVYGSDGWHVALVNYTASSQLVELSLPATGTGTITQLTAPSPTSSAVTFGGQTITSNGTWSGPLNVVDSEPVNGTYPVVLPPASAAIFDVAAAPGTTITAQAKTKAKTTKNAKAKRPNAAAKLPTKRARARS